MIEKKIEIRALDGWVIKEILGSASALWKKLVQSKLTPWIHKKEEPAQRPLSCIVKTVERATCVALNDFGSKDRETFKIGCIAL